MNEAALWKRYQDYLCTCDSLGLTLDISRMNWKPDFFERMKPAMEKAFNAMAALEAGEIVNTDEQRMVGHYWLRNPGLAPNAEIRQVIRETNQRIHSFSQQIRQGSIKPEKANQFTELLLIGIGGSALGPQFVTEALSVPQDKMGIHFFDNTDPDGFDKVLAQIGSKLTETLTIVVSKSGGTKETRNGMVEAARVYQRAGLLFSRHAVCVTGIDSALEKQARAEEWLDIFPMWDWVGGRTSETSAVGLLPACLQGFDIDALLEGARLMDDCTRGRVIAQNPAALMALMWHYAGGGRGQKDLVILPYKDRLLLLSRYLQQLIMESLGKAQNQRGELVHQGIAVYGNKGSTDQHAYVQQLRDGVANFFVTFIEVLKDRGGASEPIENGATSGDYLLGFLLGTRRALYENGRESMTITIPQVEARTVGALIALFERAVGFYASLVQINAYHQPGVEAGKKAAEQVLQLQSKLLATMSEIASDKTADEWAEQIGEGSQTESIYKLLVHLAKNGRVSCTESQATASRFQAL